MNIALLTTTWYPEMGGGIIHVKELANRLVDDYDCTVTVITKSGEGNKESKSDVSKSVSIIQIPGTNSRFRPLNELRYTVGIWRHVVKNNYDLVHAHTNTATFPLQILNLWDYLTVITVHGAQLDLTVTFTDSILDSIYSFTRQLILQRFRYDLMISVSKELEEVLSQYHDSVSYIPNGVDVEKFPEPGEFNKDILFVGRLRPKKNPTDLVKAMPQVLEDHPESKLHIVGEGPLLSDVRRSVVEHDISDAVEIHGRVSESTLQELYKKCSIFVLPSDWEGHPLVLLEAWASGLVVVGTDVEGIREYIQEHDFGLLANLHDTESIASNVSKLLSEPTKTGQKAKNARKFVEREFTWENTVDQTYDQYHTLVNRTDDY